MAGYWPIYFFCMFVNYDGVKVEKHEKIKTMRPISSYLD